MYDVAIVGAGIAGMTAAIYAARAGKKVLILENKACGGQILPALRVDNWPGDPGVSGADLSEKIYHQMSNLGVETKFAEVTEVAAHKDDKKFFVVETDEGDFKCKAVIIATGTEPRKLSESQAKDAGKRPISYCATCDGALYKDKPVVVVGSGNTAKHEIKYLENIASKVYHIHHDDPIPKDVKAVFVAIGRVPNAKIFADLVDMDSNGYIVADEDCHTSCSGVFAAGDVRTKSLRQLVTAASDGAMSAIEAIKYLR